MGQVCILQVELLHTSLSLCLCFFFFFGFLCECKEESLEWEEERENSEGWKARYLDNSFLTFLKNGIYSNNIIISVTINRKTKATRNTNMHNGLFTLTRQLMRKKSPQSIKGIV